MRVNWKALLISLALPLGVGGLAALLTRQAMEDFSRLNQPPLSPPSWLFPVVWTILYLMMGLASYLVWQEEKGSPAGQRALTLYAIQLGVNFFWSILFFRWKMYLAALLWLVLLWVLILATMAKFFPIRKAAGWLLTPYLLWVTFAAYLNWGIFMLN